jgi:hypothetical protein
MTDLSIHTVTKQVDQETEQTVETEMDWEVSPDVDDTWRRLVAKSKSEECRCSVRLEVCFKNQICPNTIPVLMTGTGIYYYTFCFMFNFHGLFESGITDMCTGKFPLTLMGGCALAKCA